MQVAPQPFVELLNGWFRTIGRNWQTLVATSLLVQVPIGLAVLIAFWVTGAAGYAIWYIDLRSRRETLLTEQLARH